MAHLYWRVIIYATHNPTSTAQLSEVQMYDSSGTSLCSGGTATASSSYDANNVPSNAFDGSFTTNWTSSVAPTSGSPQWIAYQFSSAVDVAVTRLTLSPSGGGIGNAPSSLKLQYSDDGFAYADAPIGLMSPTWGDGSQAFSISFPASAPTSGSYTMWRVRMTAPGQDGTFPGFAELALRSTPGGASLTTPIRQYAIALDAYTDWGAAFDGNLSTPYYVNGNPPPDKWIGYAFSQAVQVNEIGITAPNDSNYGKAPTAFSVDASNNAGATWTSIKSFTPATWTIGSVQTFTVTSLGGTGNPNGASGNIGYDQIIGSDRYGSGSMFVMTDGSAVAGHVVTLGGTDGKTLVDGGTMFTGAGDLSGSSTSQTVVGIQGKPVISTAPTNGQILTYVSVDGKWEPKPPASVIGFVIGNGATGTNAGPMLIASHAGTVSQCVVVVKASDTNTPFQFAIRKSGTNVFTSNPSIAAATASGTVSSFPLSAASLSVALNETFSIDILQGSSTWQLTAQLM